MIIALGFTGVWKATFTPVEGGIRVTAALDKTDFHLYPGESLRNIRILTLFWQDDIRRAFNRIRNYLVRCCIPTDAQGEPFPPVCCISWGGMKTKNHLRYIDFIKNAGLKFDCYWIDAGWFGPDHETTEFQDLNTEDWTFSHGDWSPNRCVHPDGLAPISRAAADAGMDMLLWLGSYIGNHGIGWHAEHPEWAGDHITEPHAPGRLHLRETIHHVLNIDIPEAREWLTETVASTLKENQVRWYREDCRLPVIPDEPGRTGVGAMKSVAFLYEFWDELRTRIPGLQIDNCGGGGSRIDLETLRRAYVLWRSDYNCYPDADPIGAQVGNFGLGHFIPLVNCAPPSNPGSTYTFLSGLYGGMSFGLFHVTGIGDPQKHTWFAPDYPVEWHRQMLEHYRLAKPYLSGNFYPLTPCTTVPDTIPAYQFDRPDLESGIILCFFRPQCIENSLTIAPVLTPGHYRITDVIAGTSHEIDTAADDTLTLHASAKPQGFLLYYQKI